MRLQGKKIATLVADGVEDLEYYVPMMRLQEEGAVVVYDTMPPRDWAKISSVFSARYPGVKRYIEETRAQARERGYVQTVFGRRLYLPDINARNKQFAQAAERAAINAPMQGTAADIIKRAMISVDRACTADSGARLIMQVHDELVLEVAEDQVGKVIAMVREHMMGAASLRVPLKVDVGTGANWDEAH